MHHNGFEDDPKLEGLGLASVLPFRGAIRDWRNEPGETSQSSTYGNTKA